MLDSFGRLHPYTGRIPSLIDEAGRMRAFLPPFRFTSFFSPEDTLLCMLAAEAALAHARGTLRRHGRSVDPLRITELTTGSGLVGMHLLRLEHGSRLTGLDVDRDAVETARSNAATLGLTSRTMFDCADVWSETTVEMLASRKPQLLVCNPPYIPEPENQPLEVEAGSGADGAAHLNRTIDLAERFEPRALALSWCSLSDPAGVVERAERAGYCLNSLFVAAIADGEYSGSVHSYLRSLDTAFINESRATLTTIAPDGSARFSYLLFAGDFSRDTGRTASTGHLVKKIVNAFAADGLSALESTSTPIPVRTWLLDRWDELRLRAFLHGPIESHDDEPAMKELYG
jgi:methylase of polypeptide subunit release factors